MNTIRRRMLHGGALTINSIDKTVLVKNQPGGTSLGEEEDGNLPYTGKISDFYIYLDFVTCPTFPADDSNFYSIITIFPSFLTSYIIALSSDSIESLSYSPVSLLAYLLITIIPVVDNPGNLKPSSRHKIILKMSNPTDEDSTAEGEVTFALDGFVKKSDPTAVVKQPLEPIWVNIAEGPTSYIQTWNEISIINQDLTEEQMIKLTTI